MHEWSDLSRGRALALVSARDPREFPIGIMQRDPVPPPHTGPGTFIWFADDAEAADFMVEIVPVLLLDPESWPDFEALVAETRRIVQTVPDDGAPRIAALRDLSTPWGPRADFVWWGEFEEISEGTTDLGRLIRLQFVDHHGLDADELAPEDLDRLVSFLRAYPL